ncbi:12677_t:CDS:2, partial [Funneliformis geosporum]
FALKFEPASKIFYELIFQKTENQVSYLKTQLRDIQSQLTHQERIFARIEIRRQGAIIVRLITPLTITKQSKLPNNMASIELKFQGTFNKSDYLREFSCGSCQQYLTEQDISIGNYRLYVSDYANEVDKEEYFSTRLGRHLTTYGLNF